MPRQNRYGEVEHVARPLNVDAGWYQAYIRIGDTEWIGEEVELTEADIVEILDEMKTGRHGGLTLKMEGGAVFEFPAGLLQMAIMGIIPADVEKPNMDDVVSMYAKAMGKELDELTDEDLDHFAVDLANWELE